MKPMPMEKKSGKMVVLALKSKPGMEKEEESPSVEGLEDMLEMVMESEGEEKNMAIDALVDRLKSLRD